MKHIIISIVTILLFSSIDSKSQQINQLSTSPSNVKSGISFTENKGQVSDQNFQSRPDVFFSGSVNGMNFHLRNDGVSYQLKRIESWKKEDNINGDISSESESREVPDEMTLYRVDMNWIGSNSDFKVEYGENLPGYNNYYLAVCPEGITHVKSFKSISYKNLYDGIDIRWYENEGSLEYDFNIDPGADYTQIKWAIEGAKDLYINEEGGLVISTPLGKITEAAPKVFQKNEIMKSSWVLKGNIVSFIVDDYNPQLAMIIDPVVRVWSTYYGGTNADEFRDSYLDASNNITAVGGTKSTSGIATTGAHQTSLASGFDVMVVKFNSNGVRLWSTYKGGFSNDNAQGCVLDDSANVYIVGATQSSSSFATFGSFGGIQDVFVLKFDANGTQKWCRYYGGSNADIAWDCALDDSSYLYITGYTGSSFGISTFGSHQSTYGGGSGQGDAFLSKFNSSGQLLWGTYYGGNLQDEGFGVSTLGSSHVFLVGSAQSTSNIASTGAYQTTKNGNFDSFISKFDNSGKRNWGTYYGGSGFEIGQSLKVLNNSDIIFAGITSSNSGIATSGVHQVSYNDSSDAFIARFDSSGLRIWGSYFGGGGEEDNLKVALDNGNNIYIVGRTSSDSSIVLNSNYQTYRVGGQEGFIVNFNLNGTVNWGTYYGDTLDDYIYGVSAKNNVIYLSGETRSYSGFSTPGAHQSVFGGSINDGFLSKFVFCSPSLITNISLIGCDSIISPSGNYVWYSNGNYFDTLVSSTGCDSILNISVSISTIPLIIQVTDDERCGSGSVSLSATSSTGIIYWYPSSIGGIPLDSGTSFSPNLLNSNSYYVEAVSNGCTTSVRSAVEATINTIPVVSQVTNGTICDSGSTILYSSSNIGNILWYNTAVGGTIIGTGDSITTPILNSSLTYFVEGATSKCTTFIRIQVNANVFPTPNITSTTPDTRCGSGPVNLSATSSAGTISWYSFATGGIALTTGTSYSPIVSTTTTFYVDATSTGCTTTSRTAVIATVNPVPGITSTTADTRCDAGTVNLAAVSSAGTISWFSTSTGGTALTTGTTYAPTVSSTTTFYVDATSNGCTTASRTAIIATVNTTPSVTSTTPDTRCETGTVNLSAASSAGTINWYANSTGGTALTTGMTYAPTVSSTTTYFVDATSNGCTTASRSSVLATVLLNSTSSIDETACFTYTSPSGNHSYSNSGTFLDTIPNSVGCDSIITINLTINTSDTTVSQNGKTLTASATSATFQWIDCDNGNSPVSGETNSVFAATTNGNYAVIVTQNGCSDTSDCYEITTVGLANKESRDIRLYPNPSSSRLTIELDVKYESIQIMLMNDLGQVVLIENYSFEDKIELDLSTFANGMYTVQLVTDEFNSSYKLLKN